MQAKGGNFIQRVARPLIILFVIYDLLF